MCNHHAEGHVSAWLPHGPVECCTEVMGLPSDKAHANSSPGFSWCASVCVCMCHHCMCSQMLGRQLSRAESRAIIGEAKCSVCMRCVGSGSPRSQSPPRKQCQPAGLKAAPSLVTSQSRPSMCPESVPCKTDMPVACRSDESHKVPTNSDPSPLAPLHTTFMCSTRDQAPGGRLVCCPECHWGWACEGSCAQRYLGQGGGHTRQAGGGS